MARLHSWGRAPRQGLCLLLSLLFQLPPQSPTHGKGSQISVKFINAVNNYISTCWKYIVHCNSFQKYLPKSVMCIVPDTVLGVVDARRGKPQRTDSLRGDWPVAWEVSLEEKLRFLMGPEGQPTLSWGPSKGFPEERMSQVHPLSQNRLRNLQGPVRNGNVRSLVQKIRIPRWRLQNMKPSVRPFWAQAPMWLHTSNAHEGGPALSIVRTWVRVFVNRV